ncbi:unnamed protein product [Neisseria lactamica Y92-1009]|nr:unnamed protein product [Neisseria lactamica Y92-1009]
MITVNTLQKMKAAGEKIAMLTAYKSSFAALMDEAGVEMLLVGDSLGMAVQGRNRPLPVTRAICVYHTECVARGAKMRWIVGICRFGAYQQSKEQAFARRCRTDGGRSAYGQTRRRRVDGGND